MRADPDELLRELNDSYDEISRAAAHMLAQLGERRAIEPLLAMLDDCVASTERDPSSTANSRRCFGVISALASFREPSAFDGLVQVFRQGRGLLQEHAAQALGIFGDPRSGPVLWDLLPGASAVTVARFVGPQGMTVANVGGGVRHAILEALARLHDPGVIPPLIEEFTHPDQGNVARQAARLVNTFGETAFLPLVEAQTHADTRVRVWATVAFEGLHGASVLEPLVRALADAAPEVRRQAARILGELGDARAIDPLQTYRDDPDDEVRKYVASSLRKLGARRGPRLPRPGRNRHILDLYADYNQFYLGDASFQADTAAPDFWSADAFARKLAISPPGLIGVGTVRYDTVPVVVEVHSTPPMEKQGQWDHVVEASLELPSGRLVIDGCTSYRPETSPHIELSPGTYRVRICYAGQDTVDEDWYRVVLWPHSPYEAPRIAL